VVVPACVGVVGVKQILEEVDDVLEASLFPSGGCGASGCCGAQWCDAIPRVSDRRLEETLKQPVTRREGRNLVDAVVEAVVFGVDTVSWG